MTQNFEINELIEVTEILGRNSLGMVTFRDQKGGVYFIQGPTEQGPIKPGDKFTIAMVDTVQPERLSKSHDNGQ